MAAKNSIWFNGQEYRWNESQHDYVHYGDGRTTYSDAKVRYAATGAQGVQGVQGVQGIEGVKGVQGVKGIQGAKPTIWYNGYEYEYDEQDGEYVRWARVGDKSKKFTLKEAKAKDKQKEEDDESSPLLFKGLSSSNEDLQKYAEHLKSLAKTEDVQKEQKELFAHITKLCDQWVDENKGKFSSTEEFEANRNQAFSKIGLACSSFLETINSEIKNRKEKKIDSEIPPFEYNGFTTSPEDLEKFKEYLKDIDTIDLGKEKEKLAKAESLAYSNWKYKTGAYLSDSGDKQQKNKVLGIYISEGSKFEDLINKEIKSRIKVKIKSDEPVFIHNDLVASPEGLEEFKDRLAKLEESELKHIKTELLGSYFQSLKDWEKENKGKIPEDEYEKARDKASTRIDRGFTDFKNAVAAEIKRREDQEYKKENPTIEHNGLTTSHDDLEKYKTRLQSMDWPELEKEESDLLETWFQAISTWINDHKDKLPEDEYKKQKEIVSLRLDGEKKKFSSLVKEEIDRRKELESAAKEKLKNHEFVCAHNGFEPTSLGLLEYAVSLKNMPIKDLKKEYYNVNHSLNKEFKEWSNEAKKYWNSDEIAEFYNNEYEPLRSDAYEKFEKVIDAEFKHRENEVKDLVDCFYHYIDSNHFSINDDGVSEYQTFLKSLPDKKRLQNELTRIPKTFEGKKYSWDKHYKAHYPIELRDEYQDAVFARLDEYQKKFEDAVNNEVARRQKQKVLSQQKTYSLKKLEPYVPDVSFFPESASGIEVVKSDIGGSTGAKLVKDANGNHFIMKYGNSAEHIVNEAHADAFYQAAGAKVPGFKLYTDDNGKPVKLASEIKDATNFKDWWGSATEEERDDMRKKILKDFAVDVLVGNWDFIGDWDSNILVDSEGTPWRIDNGCSFGFRGQGDRKTDAEWNGFVDDLFTMTGNSAAIGSSVNSTIQKYLGTVRPLDVALEIASRDWSQALDTLPEEERDVVERRLVEMHQLAERGVDNERFGRTAESTDEVIAYSYRMSKDGLREALNMKIELDENNLAKWDDKAGWFKDGNETKTLNGKDYGSFGEYLADKMGGEGFNFITNANEDQGIDSYNLDSVSRKLCVLKSQGFDCTDPKYQTFDDFAKDLENAGYFYGVYTTQLDHFRQEFSSARNNPDAFKRRCKAANQYDAAIQLILENVEMENVDPKTRTFILFRREGYGVVRDESGNTPMPGERTFHRTGVCESHFRVRPISFKDYATAVRVPFSRVHGLWLIERALVDAGVFKPKHKTQFAGRHENESVADTHGLVIIYGGDGADIPTSRYHLEQYEHDHPEEFVTGALFDDKNQET